MHRPSTLSSVVFDDSGPRALPSYLRAPPPPPILDRLSPSVPDVSLVFSPSNKDIKTIKSNTTGKSLVVNRQNHFSPGSTNAEARLGSPSTTNFSITSEKHKEDRIESLLTDVIDLMKKQSIQIQILQEQVETLVKCQKLGISEVKETGVQTDPNCYKISTIRDCKGVQKVNGENHIQRSNSNSPTPRNLESNKKSMIDANTTQPDFSNILNNLQLPINSDQTTYSVQNSSVPHIDLPEFTEYNPQSMDKSLADSPDIGPSISECESEEEIQPTVTYYKNVLGNVNRLLENQVGPSAPPNPNRNGRPNNNLLIQQNVYNSFVLSKTVGITRNGKTDSPPSSPLLHSYPPNGSNKLKNTLDSCPTDTTVYGMSSANLSFATKEYLERHGLVQSLSSNNNVQRKMVSSERILDSVHPNQPKLL